MTTIIKSFESNGEKVENATLLVEFIGRARTLSIVAYGNEELFFAPDNSFYVDLPVINGNCDSVYNKFLFSIAESASKVINNGSAESVIPDPWSYANFCMEVSKYFYRYFRNIHN